MLKIVNAQVLEPKTNRYITIAGNVGAGKSTIATKIAEKLGYQVHYEKVDGNPYLEDFYGDQAKWGFHLQLFFLAQRFKNQMDIANNQFNNIQDRSIYEDVEIFAKNLYENKLMSERDYQTYSELFSDMISHLQKPDLMIYLDGDLDTIINRIQLRGRDMEKQVDYSYWASLQDRYKTWIKNYEQSAILYVNINEFDVVNHPEHIDLICDVITNYFNS